MCVITAYGVRCFGCWLLEVRCRAAGYASGMRDIARLCRAISLILILRKTEIEMIKKCVLVLRYSTGYSCPILMKTEFS